MTVYARIITRAAPLFSDFGLTYAIKLFGQETIDDLPRYVRGPKKGKIKAWLVWKKADSGGWTKEWGVVRPGLACAMIVGAPDDISPLRAKWQGHVQALSGHRDVFTPEWRAAQQASGAWPAEATVA